MEAATGMLRQSRPQREPRGPRLARRGRYIAPMLPPSLAAILARYPSVLVAYSGGVDSSLVAVAARLTLGRTRAVAALGVSPSLGAHQHGRAVALARRFDLDLVE